MRLKQSVASMLTIDVSTASDVRYDGAEGNDQNRNGKNPGTRSEDPMPGTGGLTHEELRGRER